MEPSIEEQDTGIDSDIKKHIPKAWLKLLEQAGIEKIDSETTTEVSIGNKKWKSSFSFSRERGVEIKFVIVMQEAGEFKKHILLCEDKKALALAGFNNEGYDFVYVPDTKPDLPFGMPRLFGVPRTKADKILGAGTKFLRTVETADNSQPSMGCSLS